MCEYRNYFFYDSMVAPIRANRPMIAKEAMNCPFCKGNEDDLVSIYDEVWEEDELFVRVLANKYPIIPTQGSNTGRHDVIVDTEDHLQHPSTFSLKHWEILLLTMQKRWKVLSENKEIAFIQIFKNHGTLAGASIHHSHWQLIALTKIPLGMINQYEKYQRPNRCFLCEKKYLNKGTLIKETEFWSVIAPETPEFNYEIWLVPKDHKQHFGELTEVEVRELSTLMKEFLMVYNHLFTNEAFNICMMSGDLKKQWHYHFHIRLMVRIGHIAGFEIATHCHILIESPEQYALRIKQLIHE